MHCGNPYRNKEQSVDGDIMTSSPADNTKIYARACVLCVRVLCVSRYPLTHSSSSWSPSSSRLAYSMFSIQQCSGTAALFPSKNSCSSTAAYNVITAICKELVSLYFVWPNINVEVGGVGCRVIRGARGHNQFKNCKILLFV